MAQRGLQKSKGLALKMPLDLNLAVDREVYSILDGFNSMAEAKNFLCSAILYYSRSPLVLSANALIESLGRVNLDSRFGEVLSRIEDLGRKLEGFSVRGGEAVSEVRQPAQVLDSGTVGALNTLKQKFKI